MNERNMLLGKIKLQKFLMLLQLKWKMVSLAKIHIF